MYVFGSGRRSRRGDGCMRRLGLGLPTLCEQECWTGVCVALVWECVWGLDQGLEGWGGVMFV